MVLRCGVTFRRLSYRSGKEILLLSSHGLIPRAFTIFLFVSIRQGFPFSILCKVITDRLARLARSDLLISSLSRSSFSGFSIEISTTPISVLRIIIFSLSNIFNKINLIMSLHCYRKMLRERKTSTTKYRSLVQSRYIFTYGESDGESFQTR